MTLASKDLCHLVGSVPLTDVESVMRTVAGKLGENLSRISDGEVGIRSNWINWQADKLAVHPQFEPDPDVPPFVLAHPETNKSEALAHYMRSIRSGEYEGLPAPEGAHAVRWFARPRAGATSDALVIDPGYAEEAIRSYAIFERLVEEKVIDAETRFQICLPTATAICASYVSPEHAPVVHRAYERALLRELATIVTHLPPSRLAIQVDVCTEIMQAEGVYPVYFANPFVGCVATIARLADAVPAEAQVGFHLCYGDPGAKHFVEPHDTAVIAEFVGAILSAVQRDIDWFHFPVPPERDDDAYFTPLGVVAIPPHTMLYAGLVHDHVTAPSNADRIAAARRTLPRFGVGTECGFGRRDPASVVNLLEVHADCATQLG